MTDAIEGHSSQTSIAALWPGHRTDRQGRAHGALWRAGIHDLGSLTRCSASGLLEIGNFGPWALEEVRQQLGRLGLALRGEEVAR